MHLGRVLALGGSIALHVGALAGILLLAASLRQPEPLFVDLTMGDLTTGGLATGQPAAGAQTGEKNRPAPRSSTAPAPASRRNPRGPPRSPPHPSLRALCPAR